MNKNFAIIGVGGYIAPRHLEAIKATGNKVIAALDLSDSVGIIDKYFPDAAFFTEFERFDRHCEKLKRDPNGEKIDFVTICSPNYLHDAHIRFGLRIGADVICEKPLVLNPWNANNLIELEQETGKNIYTILQLRCHPTIIDLKEKIDSSKNDDKYDIELTYMTPRGSWYFHSWKANPEKSGGVATNIGIHFFDMLTWIFGPVVSQELHLSSKKKMSGFLELENARVKWFLSLDREDLPKENLDGNKPYRSIKINGQELEFSSGFTDLHTTVYEQTLNGKGFKIKDALPSIKIVSDLRKLKVVEGNHEKKHYLVNKNE
jgi:UDP-N-acetyl-2-amino-2-deoxyglucuronate dehydrogenase